MGQHKFDQIREEDTMDDSIDGKSKSNEESILRNWKTITQSIVPIDFVKELERCNFLPNSSFDDLGSKRRSHQATVVLLVVYRNVSSEEAYGQFLEILRRYEISQHSNSPAADALSNDVGGPINNPGIIVDKHIIEQTRHLLNKCETKIIGKLKKHMDVVPKIIDDFIECGILTIDKVENILHSPEEAAQLLVEFVIANTHLGTYDRLLKTLKPDGRFKSFVSDLTAGENIKTVTKATVQEKRRVFSNVTPAGGYSLSIETKPDSSKTYRALLCPHSPVNVAVFAHLGSLVEKKEKGSAVLTFAPGSKMDSTVKDKIQEGAIPLVMNDIIKYMEGSDLEGLSEINVKVRCINNNKRNMSIPILPSITLPLGISASLTIAQAQLVQQITESVQQTTESVQHTTESEQHTMIATIIAANRSFLIEEINTMTLVREFKDQGIICFDGLDGTLGGQQMAERFLTILGNNNLLDQLLDILRQQGMTCVLDRLNNCRNAYSADPQILRRNIFNNRTSILDNLDIDDVREIFIERGVFSSSMFDEIEEKYSGSEDQMSAVLIEIINSGKSAMRILVDVLYINQLDSLADSLLMETPNELQEMQDNTQTDESSSDDQLLYEGTYVVSKADDEECLYKPTDVLSKSVDEEIPIKRHKEMTESDDEEIPIKRYKEMTESDDEEIPIKRYQEMTESDDKEG